ncbi:MAG: hypothetical protein K2N34_10445 [Lachnospiraceae bacterium]|nr:hypothetical protein [Lachnospiraceae bacterium]
MCSAGIGTPYWYEWEIGLLKCLEMLYNNDIRSVVIQDSRFTSIDDVVVNYIDGSTLNYQVKHTDVDSNFTFSTLLSGETSMLVKWAKDWQDSKTSANIKCINIITNKHFGENQVDGCCSFKNFVEIELPQWQNDSNYISVSPEANKVIERLKSTLSFLGNEIYDFIKLLRFTEIGDRDAVEKEFRSLIATILGTSDDAKISAVADKLYSKLRIWATSFREKSEICREDIYRAICSKQIDVPRFDTLYVEKPIFPSREHFKAKFVEYIQKSSKKIIFLRGLPGSGKTNFITYLSQTKDSIIDFHFYTYLPAQKGNMFFSDDAGYYSGHYLWQCLLEQLKVKFEESSLLYKVKFPLAYGYLNLSEMRSTVLKYLNIYAKEMGRTCYVFIDGIDHAARSRMSANDIFLSQLPTESEVVGDIKFVLIGQPNDKYPNWLINEHGNADIIDLPNLTYDDILILLKDKKIAVDGAKLEVLADKILQVIGNNALNILFAIEELKAGHYEYEELFDVLRKRKLDCEVSKYYEWIFNSVQSSLLLDKVVSIFAFITQKIKLGDLARLCDVDEAEVGDCLYRLYPLLQNDSNGFYVFHNDVRLFFRDKCKKNRNCANIVQRFEAIINLDDGLDYLKYNYLFDALFECCTDKSMELFTSEYIIKSTLFNVPIMKLVEQFAMLFNLAYNKKSIDYIIKLNLSFNTLFQYVNCLEYNELINERFANDCDELVPSEKYVLDGNKDFETIVRDIYLLTTRSEYERGQKIYEEYLSEFSNAQLVDIIKNSASEETIHKLGYICRSYRQDCRLDDECEKTQGYGNFISGWLDASKQYISEDDIKKTLTFERYYARDLYDYIHNIVSKVERDVLVRFSTCFRDADISLFALIDICCALILSGYSDDNLIDVIFQRKREIMTKGVLQFDSQKISYFIKMYFCIYNRINDLNKEELLNLYNELLNDNYIKEGDRGYIPAKRLVEIANKISGTFYDELSEDLVDCIYEMTYYSNKYGAGSVFDINSHDTISFLEMIIVAIYMEKCDETKLKETCARILPIYLGLEGLPAKFKSEYLQLFRMSGETQYIDAIANYWIGEKGVAWEDDFSNADYVCNAIIDELKQCGLVDYAEKVAKIKSAKIIGYVNHKDYSLYDALKWYESLSLSENKFKYGMSMLLVSDEAKKIGDNRAANSIDRSIFKTTLQLGWQFVDALFELHNTTDDFHYWRECLLNELIDSLDYINYGDEELTEIQRLLNAWINENIERRKKRGTNQLVFLANSNHKLATKFSDAKIRDELLKKYPCDEVKQDVPVYSSAINKAQESTELAIMDTVRKQGLSVQAIELLDTYTKQDYSSTYRFLIKVGEILNDVDKEKFVQNVIVPYVIVANRYGLHGSGLDWLLDNFHDYISVETYLRILLQAVKRLNDGDPHDFYGVNEDFNIIMFNIINQYYPERIEELTSNKIQLHHLWITSCGLTEFQDYDVKFDDSLHSIKDFNRKHLGLV